MCICIFFVCFCVHFFIFVHIELIVNKRGAPEAPPPMSLSILYEKNYEIYIKACKKYANAHENI